MHRIKTGNHEIVVTMVGEGVFNVDVTLWSKESNGPVQHHARGVSHGVAAKWWKRFKAIHA